MSKSKFVLLLLLATFPFVSCKKDKTTKVCTLSEANLAGTYTVGTVSYKATPSSSAIDGSSMIDACSKDDKITFATDHTFTYADLGVKCDPPGDGTGTWSLQGNIFTGDLDSGTVQNFSCTAFTVASADVFTSGDTLFITFQRK